MSFRSWLVLSYLTALAVSAIFTPAGGPLRADEPKPAVSLLLSKASAERDDLDTVFRCEATLDNATGKELTVHSSFASAFDGLELVVTTKDGKTLAQQPYISHQSPFAPAGRDFTLKKGTTTATLVFPLRDLPDDVKVVKVRIVGTLPGSGYQRILSTETMEIKVTSPAPPSPKKSDEPKKSNELPEQQPNGAPASLADRCRKMLEMQTAIHRGIQDLHKLIQDSPDKKPRLDDVQTSQNLAAQENAVIMEMTNAIAILEKEGATVAFPEALREIRKDMERLHLRLQNTNVGTATQALEQDIIQTLEDIIDDLKKR